MSMERVKEIEKELNDIPESWYFAERIRFLVDTVKQQNEQIDGKDKQLKIIYNIIHAKQLQTQQKDQRIEELTNAIESSLREFDSDGWVEGIHILKQALNK